MVVANFYFHTAIAIISFGVKVLINIAKALNVSTDFLLGLTDVPNFSSDVSKEERILLSAFRKASDRDVAVIWQLLDPYLSSKEKETLSHLENEQKIG